VGSCRFSINRSLGRAPTAAGHVLDRPGGLQSRRRGRFGSARLPPAARVASELVQKIERSSLAADLVLNVNVPDRPYDELTGLHATRLGFRHKSEQILKDTDPYGRPIYWVGPAGKGQDAGEGTDFYAVEHGGVAITPLKVDLTRYEAVQGVADWLER